MYCKMMWLCAVSTNSTHSQNHIVINLSSIAFEIPELCFQNDSLLEKITNSEYKLLLVELFFTFLFTFLFTDFPIFYESMSSSLSFPLLLYSSIHNTVRNFLPSL